MSVILGPEDSNWAVEQSHIWTQPEMISYKTLFLSERERRVAPREGGREYIICGDCCGDEERPRKTLMTRSGHCASCGGHAVELVINLVIARRIALVTSEAVITP